jgi:hypothetical protein
MKSSGPGGVRILAEFVTTVSEPVGFALMGALAVSARGLRQ